MAIKLTGSVMVRKLEQDWLNECVVTCVVKPGVTFLGGDGTGLKRYWYLVQTIVRRGGCGATSNGPWILYELVLVGYN